MTRVDVNTFVGGYPFRQIPHPDPEVLLSVMDREEIAHALVGYLPTPWQRSVTSGNEELRRLVAPHARRLIAVPSVNPEWPDWERELLLASESGAPAIRVYPSHWRMSDGSPSLASLARSCAELKITIIVTTRFEDSRQRSWLDPAADVSPAFVRNLVALAPGLRVIVTAAGRSYVEELYFSLSEGEQGRLWFDFSWVWGPPQNDLAHLFRSIGAERFLFGSMWPLRLVQNAQSNLDLLPLEESGNLEGDPHLALPRLRSCIE